jgi:hypothetical protein
MTATTIRVQMAQRSDTAANWTSANPILLAGELGHESDTDKLKIGDGTTNWSGLTYLPIDGTWTGDTIAVAYGGTGQTTYTDGQLLIGNSTGNTLAKATLTAGTGISVTNGSGTITLAIDSDTAIADITTTATTGTLPTADGSVTIADAASPTNAELLEYCVELEAKLESALAALRTTGVIAT